MKADPLEELEDVLDDDDELVAAANAEARPLPEEPDPESPLALDDDPLPAATSSPTAPEIDAIVPELGA